MIDIYDAEPFYSVCGECDSYDTACLECAEAHEATVAAQNRFFE